jgi:hypothetical protein
MHMVNLVSFPKYLRLLSLKEAGRKLSSNGMNGIYVVLDVQKFLPLDYSLSPINIERRQFLLYFLLLSLSAGKL